MGKVIDHIDTNPLNNDLSNLRLVDEQDNRANKKRWKQFTLEEVKDKSVDELREMIAQRIEEYKDVSYSEIKAQERSEQRARAREEWLASADVRVEERKRKLRITTINNQIKRLNEQINDMYEDCYHRPDYIAEKVLKLRNQIKDLKKELSELV